MNKYIEQAYCLGYQDGHFNGYHSTLIEDGHCDRENSMDELQNMNLVSLDDVLEIIDKAQTYKMAVGSTDLFIDREAFRDEVLALKGGEKE